MKTIQIQMTLILMGAMLALFAILGGLILYRLDQMPIILAQQYHAIAEARAAEVGKELEGILDMVKLAASTSVIRSMDMDAIKKDLPQMVISDKVRNMTISDQWGRAWTTYDVDIDISEQEQYVRILQGDEDFVISEPFNSPFITESLPIITVSHVVLGSEGQRHGLVNAVVSTGFLSQVVDAIEVAQSGYAFIVNEQGNYVAHPDAELHITDNVLVWLEDADMFKTLLHSNSGRLEFTHTTLGKQLLLFSEVPNSNQWKMVVVLPYEEAYAYYLWFLRFFYTAFGLALLLILVFSYIYAKSISSPIHELKVLFDQASHGDLSVQAKTHYSNELGQAGEAFNTMIKQIKNLTYKDPITKLYNHNSFLLELKQRFNNPTNLANDYYVVLVSIDDFKRINSIKGYDAGNLALKILANRLLVFINIEELVARYYGDELIMLLKSDHQQALVERINQLKQLFNEPIMVGEAALRFKASIGIAQMPNPVVDVSATLYEASIAKQAVKKTGGDAYAFYNMAMNQALLDEQMMEEALFLAIEKEELKLVYQPIVSVSDGVIVGHEALLRWEHETYKQIPIPTIIALAERNGQIFKIGQWVLKTACKQNRLWQIEGYHDLYISVNVSPLQLEDSRIMDVIALALSDAELSPQHLNIELTETAAMTHVSEKIQLLKKLKGLGLAISVDDFGTGYSSLAYLAQLPMDTLKVDRMFVKDMLIDENALAITKTIVQMAKALSLKITAEGVETTAHLDALKAMDCDYFQGYLVSKPESPEVCLNLLKLGPTGLHKK